MQHPLLGQTRIRCGFLIVPKQVEGIRRWWCWACWKESYVHYWRADKWVDCRKDKRGCDD